MTGNSSSIRRMHRHLAANRGRHGCTDGRRRKFDHHSRHLLLEGSRTEAPHSVGAPNLDVLRFAGLVLIGHASLIGKAQDRTEAKPSA
jgi:hypothetical protein